MCHRKQLNVAHEELDGRIDLDSTARGFIPDSRSLPAEVTWNDSDNASLSYDDIAEAGPGETLPLMKEEAPEEETPEDNPKTCYSSVVPSSKAGQALEQRRPR